MRGESRAKFSIRQSSQHLLSLIGVCEDKKSQSKVQSKNGELKVDLYYHKHLSNQTDVHANKQIEYFNCNQ